MQCLVQFHFMFGFTRGRHFEILVIKFGQGCQPDPQPGGVGQGLPGQRVVKLVQVVLGVVIDAQVSILETFDRRGQVFSALGSQSLVFHDELVVFCGAAPTEFLAKKSPIHDRHILCAVLPDVAIYRQSGDI